MNADFISVLIILWAVVYWGLGLAGTAMADGAAEGEPPRRITSAELRAHASELYPLNSLIISAGDTLRDRYYFNGQRRNETLNIKSASKSLLSALVGIAIEQGHIDSLRQPVHVYLDDYFARLPDTKETQRKKTITVRDLLLMSSGLESTSGPGYGRWVISDNWTMYALEQPLVNEPGSVMDYSTGDSHILSAVLSRATGRSILRYARQNLFYPMNMKCTGWQRSPEGFYFGGNNVSLRPIDLLKYGRLYLNKGRYNGQQLVPESWVKESTQPYKETTIKGEGESDYHKFGYLWWNHTFGGYRTFFGLGFGGQYVFVLEELDAVVVMTHSIVDHTQYGRNKRQSYKLLEEWVIPYLRGIQ